MVGETGVRDTGGQNQCSSSQAEAAKGLAAPDGKSISSAHVEQNAVTQQKAACITGQEQA